MLTNVDNATPVAPKTLRSPDVKFFWERDYKLEQRIVNLGHRKMALPQLFHPWSTSNSAIRRVLAPNQRKVMRTIWKCFSYKSESSKRKAYDEQVHGIVENPKSSPWGMLIRILLIRIRQLISVRLLIRIRLIWTLLIRTPLSRLTRTLSIRIRSIGIRLISILIRSFRIRSISILSPSYNVSIENL